MILISDRPPEAEDRAVPGHWEGDLIIGKGARSTIETLVERSSRYVILLHLPNGRTAEDVRAALTRQISKLPAELRRTLTWDQGKEMADHVRFATDTNMQGSVNFGALQLTPGCSADSASSSCCIDSGCRYLRDHSGCNEAR